MVDRLIRGASDSVAGLRSRIAIEVKVSDRACGSSCAGWTSSFDPGTHDLSSQPVPACLGLCHGGHASRSPARRVSSPGEQEHGDVGVQGAAGLEVAVVLDVDGVAEQGPFAAVVVFDVVTSVKQIKQITQPRQVLVLDCEVCWRPGPGSAPSGWFRQSGPDAAPVGDVAADYRVGDASHPVFSLSMMVFTVCRCPGGALCSSAAAYIHGGGPGSSGPAALLVRYFCGELAFLAGTVMSGAVTWNTSSANFRWLASSCSAKS